LTKCVAWVAGEALIDLLPLGDDKRAVVGGGAANTAKALANLGIRTLFIGGISSDEYGALIRKELESLDLSLALNSDLPTALAVVSLGSDGSASYEFRLEGTATFDFRKDWLSKDRPEVLHVGTLATIIEPGASELFEWARVLNVPLVFDPNVRPSVLPDREKYRDSIEKWARIASVVKLSDEDLAWLGYKGVDRFFELGAKLVVVTLGANGIDGYAKEGLVSVPSVAVDVVDTVGAGDTVGAVLVEGLLKYGLEQLVSERLFEVLNRAAKAAAITCTRAGAKPPTREELERL
jgi:fructokinase